jgi:hypothetical protein
MIEKTLTAFIDKVKNTSLAFGDRCREYEGEFEALDKATIFTPAALCEVMRGSNDTDNYLQETLNLRIVLATRHLKKISKNTESALRMIDTLKSELHDQVLFDSEEPIARLKYTGFEKMLNALGLKVYELSFTAEI